MKHYAAPWSLSLIVISVLASAVCVAVSVGLALAAKVPVWVALGPLVIVAGAALFTIRGYTITPEAILIRRLLWTTRLPRAGLASAHVEPGAMRGSLRTCGNGGLFSFSGFFYNQTVGSYRAYVTDPRRAVVLRFSGRIVIVSPDPPEEFARELALNPPPPSP